MAKAKRGTKRQCLSCDTKYYDLERDPILCPACGAEYVIAAVLEKKAAEKVKVAETEKAEADPAATEAAVEVVSLDEVEADEADAEADDEAAAIAEVEGVDDLADDSAAPDDNTFLETDDEDGQLGIDVPVERSAKD